MSLRLFLTPKVRNLGFVLNESLTVTDHFGKVCQIQRSLNPHAVHTPFEVTNRLVLSLILLHVNYENIVFSGPDSASQRRLGVAFEKIQFLSFLSNLLHFRHPSYLFYFVSSTSTRYLTVPPHSTLAMSQSWWL
jgi:hypothetical protein